MFMTAPRHPTLTYGRFGEMSMLTMASMVVHEPLAHFAPSSRGVPSYLFCSIDARVQLMRNSMVHELRLMALEGWKIHKGRTIQKEDEESLTRFLLHSWSYFSKYARGSFDSSARSEALVIYVPMRPEAEEYIPPFAAFLERMRERYGRAKVMELLDAFIVREEEGELP